jgi:hypothetical protein
MIQLICNILLKQEVLTFVSELYVFLADYIQNVKHDRCSLLNNERVNG